MLTTDLLHTLQRELELMQHFFYALEKENTLLLSNYANNELYDLTELKNSYTDQLHYAAQERDSQLVNLKLEKGREGLLAAQHTYPDLTFVIHSLFELTAKAQELNEQNGVLIHAYLVYTQEALTAIKQANPNSAAVYDASGKKQNLGGKRGYVQA